MKTRMKLMAIAGGALLIGALAGCDNGTSNGAHDRQAVTMKPSSEYVEQLRALSELNRGLALRRAVQDEGNRCKRVERSGYQEDYKNLSMWTLRCTDTGDWAVFIAPNGDVQSRKCADLAELKLPVCRMDETSDQAGSPASSVNP
jgi:hypothetical protein